MRHNRAFFQSLSQFLVLLLRSDRVDFHPAVPAIPDKAPYSDFFRCMLDEIPEAYALHTPRNCVSPSQFIRFHSRISLTDRVRIFPKRANYGATCVTLGGELRSRLRWPTNAANASK